MFTDDDDGERAFAEAAFARMAAAADPILAKKLEALGGEFSRLTRKQQTEILKSSIVEAAASLNPNADFDGLRRVFDMMGDDRFTSAMGRLRGAPYGGAFDPAIGIDSALVLAAAGLPLQPMDRKSGRPFGRLAIGIDEAQSVFDRAKSAWVGYHPATAPFYMMVTDCVVTAYDLIRDNPIFADLRHKMEAGYGGFPSRPLLPPFRHGVLLFGREPSDQIATVALEDPSPQRGSVMLLAGWMDHDKVEGVPNGGVLSVPAQFVRKLIEDPQVLQWVTRPVGNFIAPVMN